MLASLKCGTLRHRRACLFEWATRKTQATTTMGMRALDETGNNCRVRIGQLQE